jgi:2-polyprenyl-3-methyl-5-hydroxy-6-metoxy-1,4-benzoquinol methylase
VTPSRDGRTGDHYSYSHYASRDVASGFDALRFGGPVGRFLLESQEQFLLRALAPLAGKTIADVGAGTGRASIGLARAGAVVTGLDASAEMLEVARERARAAGVAVTFDVADAHALPLGSQSVDAAVCLRVVMHTIDWQRVVAELCRVSRETVILDFPSVRSFAAVESRWRRRQAAAGRPVEAYRVLDVKDVSAALEGHGFRVVTVDRQFVLPINLHKRLGSLALTRSLEAGLAAVGLLRVFGSPVTVVARR